MYISFLCIGMITKGVDEVKVVIYLTNIYWAYTSVSNVPGTVEEIQSNSEKIPEFIYNWETKKKWVNKQKIKK